MFKIRISIKDYQIIKQVVLDLKPGFTTLIGPSNNGKSSIVKAMKAAIYTEPGTTPIRHGANSYIVGIQTDEHTIVYQKKEGSTKYLVDGKSFFKFGLTTPQEVSDALNMKELVLNGNKVQLNFWDQMDKPFLLDKSSGDLFKFIVDSGENDQLSSVLKSMVSDRQQINKEADVIQGSIISIEDLINTHQCTLNIYQSIVDKADTLIESKVKYEKLIELQNKLSDLNSTLKNLDDLYNSISKIDNKLKVFDKIKVLDDISNKIKNLSDLVNNIKDNNININASVNELNKINNECSLFNKLDVTRLVDIKSLHNRYINICNDIESAQKTLKLLNISTLGDNTVITNDLAYIFNIYCILENIQGDEYNIDNHNRVLSILKDRNIELDNIQKLIKICPYCGQSIGGNDKCN